MRTLGLQASPRLGQSIVLAALLVIAGTVGGWLAGHHGFADDHLTVYYTQPDGSTEASWSTLLGPAHDPQSVTFFAATQSIAGPLSGIEAVRFPPGTYVRSAILNGSTVVVDLSTEVYGLVGGSFREAAVFKSLVWTMTALPGITSVVIHVNGARIAAIPGGHFELDEPLSRESF